MEREVLNSKIFCVVLLVVVVGARVFPAEIEGDYRMYIIDRKSDEIAEDQPSIVTLSIRENDDGTLSVVQSSKPSRAYWDDMIAGQIRRAEAQGYHGIVDKLRSQKFEDIYAESIETATDVELKGTSIKGLILLY